MNIYNERPGLAALKPLPPTSDIHASNFSAAKRAADRSKVEVVPDAGPQSRGPLEGKATVGSPSPGADWPTDIEGGSTPHVGGRDDVTKATIHREIDKVKSNLDSMSEMGEMESLRLQMAMDRMSKMMSTLSNALKKASATSEEITANLK